VEDHAEERELVLPGQEVGEEERFDLTCFREDGKVYSSVLGLARKGRGEVGVIPSKGAYIPKEGDVVVGVVQDIINTVWLVDIGSPYKSFILRDEMVDSRTQKHVDMKKIFAVGDIVSGKVERINEVHSHLLSRPWKLEKSLIIEVEPKRIPRVIGKNRSMLEIIKQKTGVRMIVGQNGRVWLKDGNINLAVEAIRKIEREAQTHGLTNRITQFLDERKEEKQNG
jgi:exosome complex component RRP4